MKTPTFFIVGAPKCGTTALYTWLSAHGQVCMSCPKEPQFFAEDILAHQRNITDIDNYLRCFENGGDPKEVGEASTCYLASPSAAARIKVFSPQAKIILMLRNPVDVMYSLHSERRFSNMEQIRDFSAAVDSLGGRTWTAGRFRGQPVIRPSYREMVRFSEQVHRYISLFGRDRVHVILYDDLIDSADEVYRGTLVFLGLAEDRRDKFAVMNSNKCARSSTLHRWARAPGTTVRKMARVLPTPVRMFIAEAANRLNTVEKSRPPMNADLRKRLVKELEPEIQSLSVLLSRNLSSWVTD
jgi:hypothetical protein